MGDIAIAVGRLNNLRSFCDVHHTDMHTHPCKYICTSIHTHHRMNLSNLAI